MQLRVSFTIEDCEKEVDPSEFVSEYEIESHLEDDLMVDYELGISVDSFYGAIDTTFTITGEMLIDVDELIEHSITEYIEAHVDTLNGNLTHIEVMEE